MNEQAVEDIARYIATILATYGLQVVAAIVILVVGWTVARWVQRFLSTRLLKIPRFDATLVTFFANFARYAILVFTIIAVLNQFGVATTSLIAVLGAAGLAIGLALQGTLSNVAAGVMLLIFRPFRLGDFVDVQGASGTVTNISLFFTEMNAVDGFRITVPNSQVWGNAIRNYNVNPTRRMEFRIGVAYDTDIERAFSVIHDVIAKESRILPTPAPEVVLDNLGASAQELAIRMWANIDVYWPTRFDMMKAIKERLDAEGIEIPFPHQVLHLHAENGQKPLPQPQGE